ncbi:hypothetical protein L3X38_011750 [Prunus dulcis]|uniref:Uncharacterized protein n=1 Tax=Prunus dulcis TaxID=3755 RepID=A0AAD4WIC2_PRUDU|nr:hypothetical protein L3X38_011750 [Prunus dulcis]
MVETPNVETFGHNAKPTENEQHHQKIQHGDEETRSPQVQWSDVVETGRRENPQGHSEPEKTIAKTEHPNYDSRPSHHYSKYHPDLRNDWGSYNKKVNFRVAVCQNTNRFTV